MHPQILVVADPPHRTVDLDAVAEILGVAVDDATLKVGFPAPEVLLASGPYRADEVAHGLRGAGLNVGVIDAEALVHIPWPAPAASFAFEADGLVAQVQSQIVCIPYDAPLLGVYCKPPLDFSAPLTGVDAPPAGSRGGLGIAEAIQWMANLDLYFSNDAGLQRISIVQEVADFSGLGGRAGATAAESLAITVEECADRIEHGAGRRGRADARDPSGRGR